GHLFNGCSNLKSVTIPDGVTTIAGRSFKDCTNLTSITIPDSVTSIRREAFHNCTSLKTVTIPGSVTSIGNAFDGCTSLTAVIFQGNAPFQGGLKLTDIDPTTITIYRKPDAKGWYDTFMGIPVKLISEKPCSPAPKNFHAG
ncbi:MAG: leucine-rich repeat domain-containing protein, partial [Roseibacillus sp.]|nr:leucine-rich repeat domain-containing protein [Roseibacillus sp.]